MALFLKNMIKFPKKILLSIAKYFEKEKKKTKKRLSAVEKEDPFADTDRLIDNAASDTEAKEQFGHLRAQSLKKELLSRLHKIETALLRVKKGKYGFCEKCGKMIDTDRLAANPAATLCLKCEKASKA